MLVSDTFDRRIGQIHHREVLILVLVDVGLGLEQLLNFLVTCVRRLNPCFSGCWSRTRLSARPVIRSMVLILVLVDVGLGRGNPPGRNESGGS